MHPNQPGQPIQLKGGDQIRFADVDMMFVLAGYVPSGATVYLPSSNHAPSGSETDSQNAAEAIEAPLADSDRGDVVSEATIADPGDSVPAVAHELKATDSAGAIDFDVTEPRGALKRSTTNAEKQSSSTAPTEPPDFDSDDAIVEAPGETSKASTTDLYRACLDIHLERVEEISPAFASFVARGFDEEMRGAVSIAATELIQDAQVAQRVQQRAYSAAGIRYLICAVPNPMNQARERFIESYGGFTRLLAEALQEESFRSDRCAVLVVLSFGRGTEQNAAPWVSLSIVPEEGQDAQIDLLSYEFLSNAERRDMRAGADSKASRSGRA